MLVARPSHRYATTDSTCLQDAEHPSIVHMALNFTLMDGSIDVLPAMLHHNRLVVFRRLLLVLTFLLFTLYVKLY
jgi:hypothetical protein